MKRGLAGGIAGTIAGAIACSSSAPAPAGPDFGAPSAAPAYFNSAPVADETVDVFFGGAHHRAKGINVAPGQTKIVDVQLFSDAPTAGPWTVSAFVVLVASDGTILPKVLDVALDGEGGVNGKQASPRDHCEGIDASRRELHPA